MRYLAGHHYLGQVSSVVLWVPCVESLSPAGQGFNTEGHREGVNMRKIRIYLYIQRYH
jgi:hypothetical protein